MGKSESVVGSVAAIYRYPVTSMLGEELAVAAVGPRGIAGDRAYALVDDETGKVVSSKHPNSGGRCLSCVRRLANV